jgi:hypothetical protein
LALRNYERLVGQRFNPDALLFCCGMGTWQSNNKRFAQDGSIQNDSSLKNEGDRSSPTLNGLSSSNSAALMVDISETSTVTFGYNRQNLQRIFGKTPNVADEL